MSIGYKIPAVVHTETGLQKKMWKNKNYAKNKYNKALQFPKAFVQFFRRIAPF